MSNNPNPVARLASLVIGAILALVGVMFLLNNFYDFLSIGRLWPLFMLIPAVLLALIWADKGREASGLVIPITILVFYAGYFLWLNYTCWQGAGTTWPNYLIGPGLGFVLLYFIDRNPALLVPAFILLGLAAIFFSVLYGNSLFIGGFLILVGLFILIRGLAIRKEEPKAKKK